MHRQVNIQRLRVLREARGWSQEHLAEVAGISLRTVQRMEAGRPISADAFQAVASAFDTEVSELLAKPASRAPIANVTILPRVRTGKQLCDVTAGADMFQDDYDAPEGEAEVELIGSFLQQLHDLGEIWDDVQPSDHVRAVHDLGEALHHVEQSGFRVFAARVTRRYALPFDPSKPIAMSVATFLVLRSNNPKILLPNTEQEHIASVFAR